VATPHLSPLRSSRHNHAPSWRTLPRAHNGPLVSRIDSIDGITRRKQSTTHRQHRQRSSAIINISISGDIGAPLIDVGIMKKKKTSSISNGDIEQAWHHLPHQSAAA